MVPREQPSLGYRQSTMPLPQCGRDGQADRHPDPDAGQHPEVVAPEVAHVAIRLRVERRAAKDSDEEPHHGRERSGDRIHAAVGEWCADGQRYRAA